MAQHIVVTDYNPLWAEEYRKEFALIKAVLGSLCTAIHHIGSTAVPGLKAKPVIDIMPVVSDIAAVDNLRCHPQDAAAYGELKTALALKYPYDIEAYCDGKDAFVKNLERKALLWAKNNSAV